MRDLIIRKFFEALEQTSSRLLVDQLNDDSVLLETGLDSLGFAILVALLEEELSIDPFQLMDEPVYPKTFGEFVAIYQKVREHIA